MPGAPRNRAYLRVRARGTGPVPPRSEILYGGRVDRVVFGHEPLSARSRSLFDAYARDAIAAKRYDFHMGRKLGEYLDTSGFTFLKSAALADPEFSFEGPALSSALDSWRRRFARMRLLGGFCGSSFEEVRDEFIACLGHPRHRSIAKVCFCLATR